MNLSLYQLDAQFHELQLLADDVDEQTLANTLEGLRADIETKALNVARFTRNLEVSADAIEAAAQVMHARAGTLRRRADWLRGYLLTHLRSLDIKRIARSDMLVTVRANPPAVEVLEGVELPNEFIVTPPPPAPRPDKIAIARALKAGEDVPGARLTVSYRVEIR